jgi:tetratricopeptide (TPR) repeat protein
MRDQQDGRLTSAWLANLTIVAARAGDLNLALQAAQEALKDSQDYTDLYSRIAWAFHYPRGEFEDLAELCRRDMRSGRCSPEGGRLCAQALYLCGEWQEASELVESYYAADGSLRDWCAAMADLPDSQVGPSPEVLYDMDLRAGRLSEAGAKRYLSYLVGAEKDQQAERLAEKLIEAFSFSPEHEIALTKIALGQTEPWSQLLCRPLPPGSGQRDEVELARFLHSVLVGRSYSPSFPRMENSQLSMGEVIFEALKHLDIC